MQTKRNGIKIDTPKKPLKIKRVILDYRNIRKGLCPTCNIPLVKSKDIPNTFYKLRYSCVKCKGKFDY